MSYCQFIFYYEHVFNDIEHRQSIDSLILSYEKPFDQIERFFPIIYVYTNLKKLHLHSPNGSQLEILPSIVPNLCELYVILKNAKSHNIKWLTSLKKLKTCSIERKYSSFVILIKYSIVSFSSNLWH